MNNRKVVSALACAGALLCSRFAMAVTVTNTSDAGPGSLRDAIAQHPTFIDFLPAVFSTPRTIALQSRLPDISGDLWIKGPGANLLTVDGQFHANQDALLGIFFSSPVVRLEGFTLTGGYDAFSTGNVGGIFTRSQQLTLANMTISGNRGTAIFNQGGTVLVTNSTVDDNTAEGLFNQDGSVTATNSTFASNGTFGIYNQVGNLLMLNSTVGRNRFGVGSVIGPELRSLEFESTVIGDNTQSDLSYDTIDSAKNCLVQSSSGLVDGIDGNIVGIDPLLGPLKLNGGTTATMLPQAQSRAIDAGSNPLGLSTDQRGFARTVGFRTDIGAVETVTEPSSSILLLFAAGTWMLVNVVLERSAKADLQIVTKQIVT